MKAPEPAGTRPEPGRFGVRGVALMVRMIGNNPGLVAIVGTLAAIVVVVLPFLMMQSEREQAIQHARQMSDNFASLIALELARDLSFHDVQLKASVRNAEDPITWTLPPTIQHRLLFSELPANAYVDNEFVIGAAGQIVASQDGKGVGPELRLNDRDYFLRHKNDPVAGLLISHPFRSRLHDKWIISLTRRINGPDGSFAGIVLFEVRLALLQRLFDRVETGPPGLVSIVLDDDGTVLASRPYSDDAVGVRLAPFPLYQAIVSAGNGSVVAPGSDGIERLYVFRRTPGVPFITIVAPAMSNVLEDWRRQQRITVGLAAMFGVVLAIGAWLLAYTLRAKLRAEVELARLASIDALTKLANRRVLDQRLEDEWQHALRNGSSLSVLFIDIDRFKLYNDTYGHSAGDDILAIVARCIDDAARRSIDCVGRYGGEEFVAVLPETGSDGARIVAESVRKRIEDLAIANPGSETAVVTVSIGCATCQPSPAMTVGELVAEADRQLYSAKTSGRNQVRASVLSKDGAA